MVVCFKIIKNLKLRIKNGGKYNKNINNLDFTLFPSSCLGTKTMRYKAGAL
jgi:hypothetical protein